MRYDNTTYAYTSDIETSQNHGNGSEDMAREL
jgi:hypothetical protein